MISAHLQAALIFLHFCAPASSQPLPSAPLQQLEETESPLIRRHSDQGLPPVYGPASALQPRKNRTHTHLRVNSKTSHQFLLCAFVNTCTYRLTVTLTGSVIIIVHAVVFTKQRTHCPLFQAIWSITHSTLTLVSFHREVDCECLS